MTEVAFSRAYNPIVEQILQYQKNFIQLSTAERAEGAIKNAQDLNKLFATRAQDNILGQYINILA
jgi:hypothetical protein